MHNNFFNYIMSGCSFTRVTFPEATEDKSCFEFIKHCYKSLNSISDTHKFSLLYNAYTEKTYGPIFEKFKGSIAEIISDSGGLQMITLGKTITEKLKDDVYDNQGTWSDTGLSFDVIPLKYSGEQAHKLDLKTRWFDKEGFERCAIETGKNIAKQIQTFIEMKSKTKPIFIAQGNCYDTYMQWTELALKQIPQEHHHLIAGVAMGATALGHGVLEDIKRAFYFTQLPMETNRLHLLAVGAIKRLVPNIIFTQSGLYKDLEISYDSTTHASASCWGRSYMDEGAFNFPIEFCEETYSTLQNRILASEYAFKQDLDEFFEVLDSPSKDFKKRHGSRVDYIKTINSLLCFTISEFIKHVESLFHSKEKVLQYGANQNIRNTYQTLYQIQDKKDFDSWINSVGRHVASKPVFAKQKKQFNMEELF